MACASLILDPLFVNTLRCPVTRLPLREVSGGSLALAGGAGDAPLPDGDAAFLIRSDGLAAYPVRGGIPVLLAEALLPLSPGSEA